MVCLGRFWLGSFFLFRALGPFVVFLRGGGLRMPRRLVARTLLSVTWTDTVWIDYRTKIKYNEMAPISCS